MPETVLAELKRYVLFDTADEERLRAFHPVAAPEFQRMAEVFYDRILRHDEARKALVGGESSVGHLKVTMVAWLDRLLLGPWDEGYWDERYKIGRLHVRIGLPQHYMFGAMNVHRDELDRVARAHFHGEALDRLRSSVGKILDLELAIMLHTYRDDMLAQQARVERLSTFGQLVGSIGHDLRNPLGVIETSLYILRSKGDADERTAKHINRIGEQLGVANGIITNLLDMIRDRPLARGDVRLDALVRDVVDSVKRPPEVTLELALDELPTLSGDAGQLRQVLVNLVENAVFAAAPKGVVGVRGRRADGQIELVVDDTGPGVDPATRRRLFEPLITTKAKGIGLGLALVKRIVERHGGTIGYDERPGGGARFTIRLPA
ncbi:MAG: protoglobin domain-containing protein [Anaeromyxobacter sp.]